jgi:hypothetical protein
MHGFRSFLYLLARLLGDANAIKKGAYPEGLLGAWQAESLDKPWGGYLDR